MRIALIGATGQMGRTIQEIVSQYDTQIVCGVGEETDDNSDFPIYSNVSFIKEAYDVLIDFSSVSIADHLLDYLDKNSCPAVLCTTAYSDEQERKIQQLAENMPIFRSANMSIGVYLVTRLVQEANKILGSSYDCEIIEAHHNRKKDAPSGTALMLAKAIQESSAEERPLVYDRASQTSERKSGEIGIQSIRAASIVGDHEVLFANAQEHISIKHHAISKELFADGALQAAKFLLGKSQGLYNMEDLFQDKLG